MNLQAENTLDFPSKNDIVMQNQRSNGIILRGHLMKQSLNGIWELHFIHPETQKKTTIPARVPGNVLGD